MPIEDQEDHFLPRNYRGESTKFIPDRPSIPIDWLQHFSTTCFDVLANAFGLLALNEYNMEYNIMASEFYLLYLDSFHSELYRIKMKTT